MRILITGASGFVGLPILKMLAQDGHDILAVSRHALDCQMPQNVSWFQADLSQTLSYQEAIKKMAPEVVIHLAWSGIPDFSFEQSLQNLNNSLNLLSYVLDLGCCKKILISGSCFEVNKLNGVCMEADVGVPKDEFTWAKHSLLNWLRIRCGSKGIVFAWLRIFYVYGPNQRLGSLIPTILRHLKEGKLPDLRTPKNSNDFIYVDDVAEAFYKSVELDIPSGIYNLGSGQSTPVIEVCKIAEEIVCNSSELTINLADHTEGKSSDINFWADCRQSNELLGWKASTSLYDGIAKTWNSID